MPSDPSYGDAISSIESGGKYDALGPETGGDRAYGKYQIMGANVGPWTKEILGQEMAPDEFLANPLAQDQVFHGKFGQYVDKYGPEGAAQAWFGGPGSVGKTDRSDVLGTTVGEYGKRFMAALGQPRSAPPTSAPPAQLSAPPSQPSPAPGASPDMPAYDWSPPQQQQLAQGAPLRPFLARPNFAQLAPLLRHSPAIQALISRG